eukprot:CAMPEP_0206234044 /NCGR_PEP_ID=MMETSP0047_2-20121206/12355_1 /ASSEMBLY_ACC=CAM_ASM_000192 /TAXON_ID=195065 /ORGANISM="Chroomonas mesostigmatica_cf, Strain CCMP1168" /LENGTH=82 /DNA_ID=CAMNT_0053658053 /DNA_START=537 /DNA_END=785 /DNA_ORIENTATION=-
MTACCGSARSSRQRRKQVPPAHDADHPSAACALFPRMSLLLLSNSVCALQMCPSPHAKKLVALARSSLDEPASPQIRCACVL